jgi:ribose-phosphate pyrophosphokinase
MENKIFAIDGRENFIQEILQSYNKGGRERIKNGEPTDILFRGEVKIEKFSDGEISVAFEESIRGSKVYLLCSTNDTDNVMKLMLAVDAAKRASADEIIAVIPYYGYSRQDRKDGMRGAIGARVIADMIQSVGAHRIITVDLHAEQIQGFFGIPVDHVSGKYIFPDYIEGLGLARLTLCSPDAGGVKRVDKIMKKLQEKGVEVNMVMLSKRRDKPNSIESMELIGDVGGRNVIIIDDIVDTAGTLCKASDELIKFGAASVRAICTHGILSGPALQRISASSLSELIISDTISPKYLVGSNKIKHVHCAPALAKLIKAINNKQSANVLEEQI